MDRNKRSLVFLGGVVGKVVRGCTWRNGFTTRLIARGVDVGLLFNPVLPPGVDYEERHRLEEEKVKREARWMFYLLGNPNPTRKPAPEHKPMSTYSIAQLVESTYNPNRITRAFVDFDFMGTDSSRSVAAIVASLEELLPGTVCKSWKQFVEEIAQLITENPTAIVFLGGTCGNNMWRERLHYDLRQMDIDTSRLFDPMVPTDQWNKTVKRMEDWARSISDIEVFFLGDPMEDRPMGAQIPAYSLAEVYLSLHKRPLDTVVCFDYSRWSGHELEAMRKVEADLRRDHPNALIFTNLTDAEDWFAKALT